MLSLDGPRMKFDRADEQIESIRSQLQHALDSHRDQRWLDIKHDVYDESPALTLFIIEMPGFPDTLAIDIGEAVHNLSSGLDHLVWQLVPPRTKRGLSEQRRASIQFPMTQRQRHYWTGVRGRLPAVDLRLPGVREEHRAFIERYQPYHRTSMGRAMRRLQRLSNTDKHRLLTPALFYPLDFHVKLDFKGAKQRRLIQRIGRGKQMKLGAELITWTFTDKPAYVSMNLSMTNTAGFHPSLLRPSPGNDFEDVGGTLRTIHSTCEEILLHFEATN